MFLKNRSRTSSQSSQCYDIWNLELLISKDHKNKIFFSEHVLANAFIRKTEIFKEKEGDMDLLGSWLFVLKRMELLKTFLQVDTALIEKTRKSKRSEVSKRSFFDKKIMRYCVLLQKYQKRAASSKTNSSFDASSGPVIESLG